MRKLITTSGFMLGALAMASCGADENESGGEALGASSASNGTSSSTGSQAAGMPSGSQNGGAQGTDAQDVGTQASGSQGTSGQTSAPEATASPGADSQGTSGQPANTGAADGAGGGSNVPDGDPSGGVGGGIGSMDQQPSDGAGGSSAEPEDDIDGDNGGDAAVGAGGGSGDDGSGDDGGGEDDGATTGEPVVGDMPLVYDEEHTGADCPDPPLPGFSELTPTSHLPDPFLMSSGERMTSRSQFRCRRAEIKTILEEYDVGAKPPKPESVEASMSGNQITINVSEGGHSFTMTASIGRPAGADSGPIPAIIGINTPTGSLPADVFSSRGIATITFNAGEVASTSFSGPARNSGNFYDMYPNTTAGYMIRWAWGVSRLIDALEQLPEANIDLSRLAVSGCSFQGKIALYAGAFDERIALTIPHESGGGGTISWRYSDMLEDRDNTEVENLHHAQGAPWYAEALRQFNDEPDKLPFDHHELIAMVAPRAFLAIESTAIARMGAEAARVDALAAREVWSALGVPDRMGASEESVNHCVWHNGFTPDLEAYVDKFLLGKEDVNTDILRSVFTIDTDTWIPWETPALD